MDLKIGDLVTRKSYENDTIFCIESIDENNICELKGIIVRPDFPIEAIPKEKHSLIQVYLPEELLMIYSLLLQILHKFNDLIQYCNYDTCPQDVDPLRWCSYQKCLQTIKLAMEKKNPPSSSFFDIL